jgi:hypothetical protein
VAPASELFGNRSNIHVSAATKTHLHLAILLFVCDESTLDADNPKTHIDNVFGVGRHGTGTGKIVPAGRQPGQATSACQLNPLEHPPGQPNSGLRLPLEKLPI